MQHSDSYQLFINKPVIVRTVLFTYTGRVTQVTDFDIVLHEQAWIADSGRWSEAVAGRFPDSAEIEAYPDDTPSVIPRGAIVEATLFRGELPRVTR